VILSAEMLDVIDRCERRFAFSREWESKSISPLALLYRALESAIQSDSSEQTAHDVTLEVARTHELQTGSENAFMLIRHYGYLAGILAVALRERFGAFSKLPPKHTTDFEWESNLFRAGKKNHRIVLVSHMDDDRLRAIAHEWGTVGELAALEYPLTLTIVIIGASRKGRRHSAWTEGYLHPTNRTLRFKRRQKGNGFTDSWEQVWREHKGEISTEKWLQVMKDDGVLDELILSREIAYRAEDYRMISARREMVEVMGRMDSASESSPMRRHSCDVTGRGCCEFQSACYAPIETSPSQLVHLYRAIPSSPST
jgi:hypothetical protein